MKHRSDEKLRAFTLIEVLIASSIFALIMIISVATFSRAEGYRVKLKQMKDTTSLTANIADMITRDVRAAKDTKNVDIRSTVYGGNIIILSCRGSDDDDDIVLDDENTKYSGTMKRCKGGLDASKYGNVLIINYGSFYKMYIRWSGKMYFYKSAAPLDSSYNQNQITNLVSSQVVDGNLISGTAFDAIVRFRGYSAWSGNTPAQQEFVDYYVYVQTSNYQNLQPAERAKSEIKSIVAPRKYSY